MTQLYFAGVNGDKLARGAEGHHVLISYADIQRSPALWAKHLRPRLERGDFAGAILDSGAFSELSEKQRGKANPIHISLADYTAFCVEFGHLFDFVVTLDDIEGDLARTWSNTAYMREHGVDPVVVYHGSESLDVLDHYIASGVTRIGLGFRRERGRIAKRQGDQLQFDRDGWLRECFARIPDHVQIHGLGMTRYARAGGHDRLDTVDSTTWIAEFIALRKVDGPCSDAAVHALTEAAKLRLVTGSYQRRADEPSDAERASVAAVAVGQARTVLARWGRGLDGALEVLAAA